jgi:DNA polymerase-3 subunit epsilon
MRKLNEIFIDLETTGLDPWKSGIIQMAGFIYVDRKEKEDFNIRIKPFPNDIISDEALAVNRISREDLKTDAFLPPEIVFKAFEKTLGEYVDKFDKNDKFHFYGYNSATFDMPFLRSFFKKNGSNFFGSWFYTPSIDVMIIAAEFFKDNRHTIPDFKLATVCKALGLEWDEEKAHEAMYDITKTFELYQTITNARVR